MGKVACCETFLMVLQNEYLHFMYHFFSEIFQTLPWYTHLQHPKIDVKNYHKTEISKFVKKSEKTCFFQGSPLYASF